MMLRRLFKHRGLGINLIAGFSFLMLAVYGWGLKWEDLGGYLFIILIFLVGLIGLAALLGWMLNKLKTRSKNTYPSAKSSSDIEQDTQDQNDDSNDDVKRD